VTMDLWQLHIFSKVVTLKSFSKAGESIHLSQPTISSHIKDLESHFGCRLIDRLGKEALPTKAGELLFAYASRLMALRDEAETAMAEFQGSLKGHFFIGGSTIPGGYILPKLIGQFTRTYPDVSISLSIGDTEKIIKDTLSGALEIGMVGAEARHKSIVQEKLLQDDMRLIVPGDHVWAQKKSIPVGMLTKEPFIVREPGSGTLKSIQVSLSKKGYSIDHLNIIAEIGSTTAVIQGIKNRIGISILSPLAVQEELNAGTLKALTIQGLNLTRSFYLTRHRQRTPSPICNAFIRFIRKESKK